MTSDLFAALRGRAVMLLDAAMGTRLIARGLDQRSDDPTLWNLDHPDEVSSLHASDRAAGSEILFTNTFGANSNWLKRFGREHDVSRANANGVALAREAGGQGCYVFGAIGPTVALDRDDRPLRSQVDALLDAGVDGLVLETFLGPAALASVRALRLVTNLPVIASLLKIEDSARSLIDAGVDGIGVNCVSPAEALTMLQSVAVDARILKLWKPSTALVGVYDFSPDEFAGYLQALIACGVSFIGGCCGATSEHIAATRRLLDGWVVD